MREELKMDRSKNRDWSWFYNELISDECACGRPKKPGYSFCYRCYRSLPGDMQRDLYKRIGEGYEVAYEAAVKWLEL